MTLGLILYRFLLFVICWLGIWLLFFNRILVNKSRKKGFPQFICFFKLTLVVIYLYIANIIITPLLIPYGYIILKSFNKPIGQFYFICYSTIEINTVSATRAHRSAKGNGSGQTVIGEQFFSKDDGQNHIFPPMDENIDAILTKQFANENNSKNAANSKTFSQRNWRIKTNRKFCKPQLKQKTVACYPQKTNFFKTFDIIFNQTSKNIRYT